MRLHAVISLVALAVILWGCDQRATETDLQRDPAPELILVDPRYELSTAGVQGYDYHQTAEADLDGDKTNETVHVIALVTRTGKLPPDDVGWDDGQPWQVYVEEPSGEVTHVYAGWIQLGRLHAGISGSAGKETLMLLAQEGITRTVYQVDYQEPGHAKARLVTRFELLQP